VAKSINANSIIKSLKKLNTIFETVEKTGKTHTSRLEISTRTEGEEVFELIKKFPYEARKAYKLALEVTANDLAASLDEAMESSVWRWNDDTRDIIDTGDLRDSQKVEVDENGIIIRYREEYAAIVHYGGYIESGLNPAVLIYYPARPWIEAVLTGNGPVEKFDVRKELEENLLEFLGKSILGKSR